MHNHGTMEFHLNDSISHTNKCKTGIEKSRLDWEVITDTNISSLQISYWLSIINFSYKMYPVIVELNSICLFYIALNSTLDLCGSIF